VKCNSTLYPYIEEKSHNTHREPTLIFSNLLELKRFEECLYLRAKVFRAREKGNDDSLGER